MHRDRAPPPSNLWSGWLRHELGTVLDLRYTPELVFEIDHSIEEGAHISALIEQLHDKDTGSEA